MATTYSDYINGILTQYKPSKKQLTGSVQLSAYSGGHSDVVVIAAYAEGLVLQFDDGNAFIPYTSIERFKLNM